MFADALRHHLVVDLTNAPKKSRMDSGSILDVISYMCQIILLMIPKGVQDILPCSSPSYNHNQNSYNYNNRRDANPFFNALSPSL